MAGQSPKSQTDPADPVEPRTAPAPSGAWTYGKMGPARGRVSGLIGTARPLRRKGVRAPSPRPLLDQGFIDEGLIIPDKFGIEGRGIADCDQQGQSQNSAPVQQQQNPYGSDRGPEVAGDKASLLLPLPLLPTSTECPDSVRCSLRKALLAFLAAPVALCRSRFQPGPSLVFSSEPRAASPTHSVNRPFSTRSAPVSVATESNAPANGSRGSRRVRRTIRTGMATARSCCWNASGQPVG